MDAPFAPRCRDGFGTIPAPLDGPVLTVFSGDAVVLPLTWWQVPPVYAADGRTVVTPGVPVDMTNFTPSAEFLTFAQVPGQGAALAVSNLLPAQGRFTVTAPGRGQPGDITSFLAAGPARLGGPRIRVHYADAAGNPHTFGTFYLTVK